MIREGKAYLSKNFGGMNADCLGEGDAANRKMNGDDENSETPANHSDDQVRGKKKNVLTISEANLVRGGGKFCHFHVIRDF